MESPASPQELEFNNNLHNQRKILVHADTMPPTIPQKPVRSSLVASLTIMPQQQAAERRNNDVDEERRAIE